MNRSPHSLDLEIWPQPTLSSCGPTCLSAVYQYWGKPVDLGRLIDEIGELDGGGTLAVELGRDALRRGFVATLATYNLQIFDPTWFAENGEMGSAQLLREKLQRQYESKRHRKDIDRVRLNAATTAYLDFLSLGGQIRMQSLDEQLIVSALARGVPILCGLSATYLYQEAREVATQSGGVSTSITDDIAGDPTGHFVILHGFDAAERSVLIADPLHPNPMSPTLNYTASLTRVASAILLGILTYDANLLMIEPHEEKEQES